MIIQINPSKETMFLLVKLLFTNKWLKGEKEIPKLVRDTSNSPTKGILNTKEHGQTH